MSSATLAGVFAGLLLTGIQQIQVIPILLKAEAYETAGKSALILEPASAEPDQQAWAPEKGWQRITSAAVGNILLGIGLGLLLGAVISLRSEISWRTGLLWGMGGYAVFFIAPSLGLPPEIPGAAAAELVNRQLWWLMTVVFSASGLWLVVFGHKWIFKLLGALLLATPHLIGAPQPEIQDSMVPPELAQAFIQATFLANASFWPVLGSLLGFFYKRMA